MDSLEHRDVPSELRSIADRLRDEDVGPTNAELDRVWTTAQRRVGRRTFNRKVSPMRLRPVMLAMLVVVALAAGAVATVNVTTNLAKSKASAAKNQYCPPQSGHGQGSGGGNGKGKACGNQQRARITQRARGGKGGQNGRGGNAHNQTTIHQQNAGRNANSSVRQR
jgi:hypothetical protein